MRAALAEIRQHAGRFLAVLAAIVVATGFLAATQSWLATETHAQSIRQAVWTRSADVVLELRTTDGGVGMPGEGGQIDGSPLRARVDDILGHDPSVAAVSRLLLSADEILQPDGASRAVDAMSRPSDPRLDWTTAVEGRLPGKGGEVVLPRALAQALRVGVGDRVTLWSVHRSLAVVGLTADDEIGGAYPVVVGPDVLPENHGIGGRWLVRLAPGHDPAAARYDLADATREVFSEGGMVFAWPASEVRSERLGEVLHRLDMAAGSLTVFGLVGLLMGALIVATTFGVLVGQRRRQVGLLRAVGATRGQVLWRYLTEALLLGVVGSGLGVGLGLLVASAVATATGSARYGLVVPWARVAGVAVAGVVMTVLAALGPLLQTVRVRPLEALQPAAAQPRLRPLPALALAALAATCVGVGTWLLLAVFDSLVIDPRAAVIRFPRADDNLVQAVAGCLLIAVGGLVAARFYAPTLLRLLGLVVGRGGPVSRLATQNASRNPGRSTATTVPVLLAVGLAVSLLVATATLQRSAVAALDARFPVDVLMTESDVTGRTYSAFSDADLAAVRSDPGVAAVARARLYPYCWLPHFAVNPRTVELTPELQSALRAPAGVVDGDVGVSSELFSQLSDAFAPPPGGGGDLMPGALVTVRSGLESETSVQLRLVVTESAPENTLLVTPATFASLKGSPVSGLMVARLVDGAHAKDVARRAGGALGSAHPQLAVTGGAVAKSQLADLLGSLLGVVVALLVVATAIALVGVANTLGLSVVERTRELALLRALGLQAAQVRRMMLLEALAITVVAGVVGVGLGVLFGWLSAAILLATMGYPVLLSVPWWLVAATVALALVASGVASLVPGIRASRAAPVDALADVG